MNKVVEYKDFIISIKDDDYIDDKTGEIIFKRYITSIIDTTGRPYHKWFKNYNRDKYTIDEIIEEAKFEIDEHLTNKETYEITLTVRTKLSNPEEVMKSINREIENIISDYSFVRLEEVKAFNKDKGLIFINKTKSEKPIDYEPIVMYKEELHSEH